MMDRKNRILMVDDDPNLLKSLTDILKLHGFETVSTTDGKSAIETARDDGIDVALIDLNLADMPGLDVLSGIKRVSPNSECMLLTGYASQDTAIEALNRGAFAYFQKPFDIDMLILAIRRAIEKRDSQTALALSEARHQMVANLTSDYVFEMSVDEHNNLTRSWISDSFTRISGYTPEEMDARGGWKTVIHTEDRGAMDEQFARLLSNQSDFREYRIVRKDGEVRWIEDFTRPVTNPTTGRVVKVIGAARDITEKKRSQQALVETENALQAMFNSVSESLLLIEADGTIVAVNQTTARRLGTDPKKLVGRNAFNFVDADVADNRKKYADQVIATGQPAHFEDVRFGRRIESSIYPVFNHQNEVQRLAIFGMDVTDRREAELELKAQAEKLESIYRAAPIGIGINANRVILEANQRFCEITGYQRDEIIGQSTRVLYPDDATFEQVGELRKKRRGPDQLFEVETKFKRKDGVIIDVLIRSSPMYTDEDAKSFVFTVQDITRQKESIRALQESEEMFSKVFNSAPFAIIISDHEDGRIVDVNPAFTVISGYEKDEVVGKSTGEMPVWQNTEDKHLVFDLLDQGHKILDQEYVMIRKDGATRYGLLSSDFIQLKGKTYNLTTIDDITERKQREIELQVMAEISEAMRTAETREEMQAILIKHLIDLLHLDGVTLEQLDPINGEREIVCAGGMWSDLEGNIIPAGAGIGAQVITSGISQLILNVSENEKVYNLSAFKNLMSAACVPLLIQDQTIGLFWVGSCRSLTEMDMRVMRSVASMAANAIHRATLHEQTLRRLDELNALRTIDQAINNSVDLNLTLELIVKQLRQLRGGDAVDILVYRPALLTLTYAAGDGFRTDEIQKSSLRIGSGGAGRVALEQKPLWTEDMRKSQSECVRKELVSAEEFIAYHACPLVVKGEIKGVLEVFHRQPFTAADEWKNILQTVATQAAIAIDNSEMFQGLQKLNTDLLLAYDETIEGWAAALELRDHETEGHSRRVTEHTMKIARAAGMNQEELQHVRRGALLHDIGKISVPDAVLNKPGPLTDEEWALMKRHPQVAYDLLSKVRYVRPSLEIPYCHHERWDGSGYPRGLKGEEIPLSARLFALVDVYDALTSGRPYREAWSRDKALEYIREQSGKHFDPQAVDLFFQTLDN